MNNYCLWFYTNANQRAQREQGSSNLWLCYLIQVLTKPRSGVCLNKVRQPALNPKNCFKRALVRIILYCNFNKMLNYWSEVNVLRWNDSEKQNPVHSVVSSGALPSINPALMDKGDLWRTISTVIATTRNKSYIRAVQKDTYLIPTPAKIGLMLDWSSTAFDSPRQQHFEMWWNWAKATALILRSGTEGGH